LTKCKEGKIDVLNGTRSAIFLPFKSLKMISHDEEHDVLGGGSKHLKFRYMLEPSW
jgi:Primosomal protein N'' (replication factor Y) - superfamily II helicase